MTVDDRVAYFQFHKGQGFDELVLKRTPVVVRIPPCALPEAISQGPGGAGPGDLEA